MFRKNAKSNNAQSKKNASKKGSMYYYEDEDQLNLDIGIIKKFADLKISAPLCKSQIEKSTKDLTELLEALQDKGEMERKETLDKFRRDQDKKKNERDAYAYNKDQYS